MQKLLILGITAALLTGCASKAIKTPVPAAPVQAHHAAGAFTPVDMAQVSRYVSATTNPTHAEINPLLAIATFSFPLSVHTVGDAVNQVLRTAGFGLAPNLSDQVKATLGQTLPFIQRNLGPMSVQTLLTVLMGAEVYEIERDPLHRLINFTVKPAMAKTLGVSDE